MFFNVLLFQLKITIHVKVSVKNTVDIGQLFYFVGGSEIIFTLNVTVKSDRSISSTSSIKFTVTNTALQVTIRGRFHLYGI